MFQANRSWIGTTRRFDKLSANGWGTGGGPKGAARKVDMSHAAGVHLRRNQTDMFMMSEYACTSLLRTCKVA